MGGKELIHKLLEIDPEVCAIVASGYSNDEAMADFRGFGFAGRIAKPFTAGKLSEVVHQVMKPATANA
ncbi:MAG: response regulator, partial [bacterium]